MNSLYLMGWSLLAQAGRFGDLGGSFRQPKNNLSGQEITFIVGAIVLAAIAIWLLARHSSNKQAGRVKSRRLLFRDLCRLHELDWSSRRLLKQLAFARDLDHPVELFIGESHFQLDEIPERLAARRGELRELQTILFGEIETPAEEAPEEAVSESTTTGRPGAT